ncbi:MAG: DUF624 domain-containing protein [Clostridia bacterium]|nr:DUF624 domain-containing protein [Clostridia bacterium]
MAQQNKGFIARMLEGKERSEEYARSTLPTNRWQLFWDIFKGNFGKIVKSNLLILVFFIPMLAVIFIGSLIGQTNSVIYPFGAGLSIGYPATPDIQGLSEMLILQSEFMTLLGVVVTSFIAAVGLAGGMYVVRNMVWTEGIFVANDFWKGVKLNYKNALQTALFFSLVFMIGKTLINSANLSLVTPNLADWQRVWMTISIVFSYTMIVFSAMMSFWMIALGVNYVQGFWVMFKNSALLAIGSFPQTLFFGVIALLPFALFLINDTFMLMISLIIVILFGFTWALLVWLDFAQWLFDKYINPKLEGAKVGRGIYNKDGTSPQMESQAQVEYQRALLASGRSQLVARPIKPIDDSLQVYELPKAFTREDLKRLRESKQNIIEDTESYAEEHKNDLRYVEYNKQFDERERAIQDDDKNKKKKRKPPKMLGE